jgi:wyosine [tRNA(Phe)-imidazoG37] synthetase (radical SAM superfamily)
MTHDIHDFTAKLRQPSMKGHVEAYVAWRRELARARAEGRPEPAAPTLTPLSINLDLTTACNYRCTHCIDWDVLNTRNRFEEDKLRASIKRLAEGGLRSVILIGGGEPTMYPGFVDFTLFLKDLGLQVAIVSNGSGNERILELMPRLEARDWVRLSLDSGSNELFELMHLPVSKRVTLDAICEWIPRLKDANPAPKIGFSYLIAWEGASRDGHKIHENIHEMELAAARAKQHRFDYIAFKPVLERGPEGAEVMDPAKARHDLEEVLTRIRQQIEAARRLEDDSFKVYESVNLKLLEENDWQRFTRQPRVCHMQALRQVLSPLGLYNCPAHRGVDKARIAGKAAYADEGETATTAARLGEILDTFDASHECAQVTCLYNGTNWWLEELIEQGTQGIQPTPEREDWFL